ncbi:hypothetical protein DT603_06510 [Pseudoxanthomonas gei]|uniref:Uncharacterized protein n=2 Tax=Pseudoxanthomonas gei TaxID=1383030 RepID=A0ABX0AC74_9GAMM|nr:hypothetical protein [Pseudoxanthomonas gei]
MAKMKTRALRQQLPAPAARLAALLACAWLAFAPLAYAQQAEPAYQPRTGDAWLDRHLADINLYAARYPQSFADEISRYYSVPRDYVEAMQQQPSWEAGDIFMACALAQALAQPCRAVVREWSHDHSEGWKGVSRRLQSGPGPVLQRKLRNDVEQSYSRWARPLKK